jgi:L-asparaginase
VLEAILNIPNLKGIVLETYGAGNAPTEDWFLTIKKSISTGLHIVNVTQCSGGSVNMGQYETSTGMKEIGVISERHHHRGWNYKIDVFIGQNIPAKDFKTVYETLYEVK